MYDLGRQPLIVAHRGASALAPENTLAAFRMAIDVRAEGIEFDVRLSRDGRPVVIHDSTLERTGRKAVSVSSLTAEELGRIDVGSWFNANHRKKADPRYSNETVPTLADALAALRDFRGVIYIELKCKDSEVRQLSSAVCSAISASPLVPQIIVKSFKLAVIPHIRFECPGVKTAALFAPKIMRYLRKGKHLVKIAEEFGADHLSLHYSLATHKLMKKVESSGIKVAIWTADKPRWVDRGTELGLFAIITNDPAKLLEAKYGRKVGRKT
ncbi:MAG: glycerophosphodiester phosphodiesterase family protein [Acidobacteriota bacterium]